MAKCENCDRETGVNVVSCCAAVPMLRDELATLRAIARDLAHCAPEAYEDGSSVGVCTLCREWIGHKPECPYQRAHDIEFGPSR